MKDKKELTEEDLKDEVFFRVKDPVTPENQRPTMLSSRIETLDNFETLKMRLDLGEGFSAVTRVFEGAFDPRFVYFPMPGDNKMSAEIICAYSKKNAKPKLPILSQALKALHLRFD